MERSGIETLLEAAALDAASFFNTSSIYSQQQDGRINQQYIAPPPSQAPLNSTQSSVYSPANSPEISYTLYSANYHKSQAQVEQQPSPYSPPDLSPLPTKAKAEVIATEVNPALSLDANRISASQEVEVWDHCSLCTPETSPQGKVDWIECSVCQEWFHYACVGVSTREAKVVDEFHCPTCTKTHGPSTLLRKSKRKHAAVDYVALHEGESVTRDEHPYCRIIQNREFDKDDFQRINGYELTREFAEMGGVSQPVVVPKDRKDGLDLKIPASLTVRAVANLVGAETKVEVIDVPTQHESPNWDMQRWADYYDQPAELRDRVRNVISLEVSNTKLGDVIQRPKFVRDMDLVQKVWPEELKEKGEWPKVSLYCLMSVKNAYTDFHIDFGGSSVFYHIVEGSKIFLFAPPTSANLSKYEHWCLSSDQSKIFFGDLVKECHKVQLTEGDTMIIPSGWIHAVYTPVDSLVIGGNFLTARDLSMEIQIAKIEKKTKVPRKFRFPHFSKVLWFAANDYMEQQRREPGIRIDRHELKGLIDLASYIHEEALTATGQSKGATAFDVKVAKGSIPGSLKDAVRFGSRFANWTTSVAKVPAFKWAEEVDNDLEDANGEAVNTLKISRKRKRSVSSSDRHGTKLPTATEDNPASSSADSLAPESSHASESFDSLKVEKPVYEGPEVKHETELAVEAIPTSASVQGSEPESSPTFKKILQRNVEENVQTPVTGPQSTDVGISLPVPQPDVTPAKEADSKGDILKEEQPSAAVPIKPEGVFLDERSEELSPPPDDLDDGSLDLDSVDYDSDAISEASTIIEEDVVETITSAEGEKNFALYQELMDLHNSRTRRRMHESQYHASNGKSHQKPRRHSVPHRSVIKNDKNDSQRTRRKSTPGGKKSIGPLLDKGVAHRDRIEYSDQEMTVPVKRGRGRPRKNPIVVNAENETRSEKKSYSGRQTSDKTSGRTGAVSNTTELDLNDEEMQRLIREAQFGIRSRR
ncbi:hypothetical protein POJ06DRAFT_298974 [Lipomyces tetrasporus]|uniref:JmjC domain-containing histone demethylation protein 1 n=1 Tax=Lipomyces tetrasporus TaxID=54092 RepID=A0AAD7QWB2_9ASCO|nr:uncharacterized protein POJ06DRAFT_298974 [Lipomyces tetrasporus]KAJ8102644.1 hypothetical protein POJ06DRAFT_298974 [Lipomyces tetrasporus]